MKQTIFKVLTGVLLRIQVLWEIMLSQVCLSWHFRGLCPLHLQVQAVGLLTVEDDTVTFQNTWILKKQMVIKRIHVTASCYFCDQYILFGKSNLLLYKYVIHNHGFFYLDGGLAYRKTFNLKGQGF
jgi:hypothetical protein